VVIEGRSITIPLSGNGVAMFSFKELFNSPYGASDFIAICKNFHSVIITEVKQINLMDRNISRRFILLVHLELQV
jgi:predicted ATPase